MTPETTQALFDVARLIGAGVLGGLIGSYATHRFTLSREQDSGRRDRKREFRSFIVHFKSEFVHHPPEFDAFADFYRNKLPDLRRAAANVENDLPRKQRAEFDQLMNQAASLAKHFPPSGASEGRMLVIKFLDAILQFLDR
jgi:hypothetical protein